MNINQITRTATSFQQPVDEQDLISQLNRQLSNENILLITELDAGLFNNTYRIHTSEDTYILKVAPKKDADVFYNERDLMQREQSIAQQIQSLSPLIPEYLPFFEIDGRDAFLQRWIQGKLWHDVISSLTETENIVLWKQLGAFAKLLHSCCGDRFGYPAPSHSFSRWSEFITDNVAGMVHDCQRLGVMHDEVEAYCKLLPLFSQTLDQVKTPKLLHGDLWPRNVIIDGTGNDIHIKAVFDAERAFWGDPVSDWVLILYGVPEAFWQGYGENLVKNTNPACITIYKGMYFILNILETTRFQESDEAPRERLSAINQELEELLQ